MLFCEECFKCKNRCYVENSIREYRRVSDLVDRSKVDFCPPAVITLCCGALYSPSFLNMFGVEVMLGCACMKYGGCYDYTGKSFPFEKRV